MPCCSATSRAASWSSSCSSASAAALVLTMDDPVLTVRWPGGCAARHPDLPIIARARDTDHAAELYRAGVTDAVPETLEGLAATVRGGAGRPRRGDGPGDRLDPREAQRAARRDHGGRGRIGAGAEAGRRSAGSVRNAADPHGSGRSRDLLQRVRDRCSASSALAPSGPPPWPCRAGRRRPARRAPRPRP